MVLGVRLEVIGQVVDPGRQQGDLHFGRPRILPTPAEGPDDLRFFSFVIAISRPNATGPLQGRC